MSSFPSQVPKDVLEVATKLAKENRKVEPAITTIYLAPCDDRVLLVEVDPTAFPNPSEGASPIYFKADPESGVPIPSGFVMITPEEQARRIPLPEGWGSWSDLQLIWSSEDSA